MLNLIPLHYVICLLRILRENSSVTFLLREKYFGLCIFHVCLQNPSLKISYEADL